MNNIVEIIGIITKDVELDYTINGKNFYATEIEAPRNSGTNDKVKVVIPETLAQGLEKGTVVKITGHYRSRDVENHLMLYLFATSLTVEDELNLLNKITLDGFLCKKPIYRMTPLGRKICDIYLAVNRSNGKNDYIPCIAWGKVAEKLSELTVGEAVKVVGRLQSREYLKNEEVRTAYEVSIMELCE